MNEELQRELSDREKVLWYGRPRQGPVLRGSDAFLIPFSLLWCGFAVFWELSVLQAPGAPAFFVVWGIPFVGIGLYFVFGRFFVDARQRATTFYAVTDERVVIVSGLARKRVRSLNLDTLGELCVSEGRSGEGTISFGAAPPMAFMYAGLPGWPGSQRALPPSFDLIPEVRTVYETIRNARSALRRAA